LTGLREPANSGLYLRILYLEIQPIKR